MAADRHRIRWALIGALALALAAGCSARSIDYYKAHPAELDRRLNDCIAYGRASTDCDNARRAYEQINGMTPQPAANSPPSSTPPTT